MKGVKWGILGTGNITKKLRKAIEESTTGALVAIASRNIETAEKWINEYSNAQQKITAYGSYDELLMDEQVDIVYIPLPSGVKKEFMIKAAENKKHILCEKPFLTQQEIQEVIEACKKNGVQFMDGTMFVHHLRTKEINRLVSAGEIGKVRHVESTFSFDLTNEDDIRLNQKTEPLGALGDLGWYNVKYTLLVYNFELPEKVFAVSQRRNGAIDTVFATLWFKNNRTATFTCSFSLHSCQTSTIFGSKKNVYVDGFVLPWNNEPIVFPQLFKPSEIDEIKFMDTTSGSTSWKSPACSQEVLLVDELGKLVMEFKNGERKEMEGKWPFEAIQTQTVLCAINEAIEKGTPISLSN